MTQQNMLGRLKILNSRESKDILEMIERQYGCKMEHAVFLVNKDNRLYVINRDVERIPYDRFRIDSSGLYFGEIYKDSLRLSIEGAQIIGKIATKNIIDLSYEDALTWIKGGDIIHEDTGRDFIIVRNKNEKTGNYDILGCGKFKDGKILNYVSKSRRLIVINE